MDNFVIRRGTSKKKEEAKRKEKETVEARKR